MNQEFLVVDVAGAVLFDQLVWLGVHAGVGGRQAHLGATSQRARIKVGFERTGPTSLLFGTFPIIDDFGASGLDDVEPFADQSKRRQIAHAHADVMPGRVGEVVEWSLHPENRLLRLDLGAVHPPRDKKAPGSNQKGQCGNRLRTRPRGQIHDGSCYEGCPLYRSRLSPDQVRERQA